MRFYYWPVLGWFYRQRLQMIMELLGEGRYGNLLEVAYGSGILMPSLATVSESLHGIDLHDKLDLVYETLRRANVRAELRSGDALSMPYSDNSFDCVVNVSMLEHLEDPGCAIDEMLRVLKPTGILALGFPCRNPWMDMFFRLLRFNPRKIHPSSHRDILKALEVRRLPYTVVQLPRGVPLDFSLYCCCAVGKE